MRLRPPRRLGRPVPPPKQPTRRVRNRTAVILWPDRTRYNVGVTTASIDPASRKALTRMAQDLRRIFDNRFVALVTSEHQTTAAFLTSIGPADLDAVGSLVETWARDHLATPLLMTVDEFRRSLDTFPAEYQ